MKKKLFVVGIIIIVVLLVLIFMLSKKNENLAIDKSNYSQIYLYNLGNSEIEIILKDDYVVMINTGLEEDFENLLACIEGLGITKIDYLILTNRDEKYVDNVSYIINNVKVEYLYLNDYEYISDKINDLLNILESSYTEKIILSYNEQITLDDLVINIYPYMEDNATIEDKTLIVNIEEGGNSLYLTSNASSKRLLKITDNINLLVSENADFFNLDAKYYIYDGLDEVNVKNVLLTRNVVVYMNSEEFIVDE